MPQLTLNFIRNCLIFAGIVAGHWGYAQVLRTSLPIVRIETQMASIPDQYKISGTMQIIDGGVGGYHTDLDAPNVYNGKIGIEIRGSSSQMFPKKAYSVETRDAEGNDLNFPLFGWPEESDWVLFPSYHEKSLMHNVLAMELYRKMGLYASRTKYVEVILNGAYQGVYVFMEKIKRAKGRVDIAKLEMTENTGDDLTGGYIIKIDKQTGSNAGGWVSEFQSNTIPPRSIYFQYEYPDEITPAQQIYIRSYLNQFETALKGPDFEDEVSGYKKYIDVQSFVNFFILNEVSRNIDGYRLSTYLYKDKESKGSKLTIGPPWDFDITFGNADYCGGSRYDLFAYKFNEICPQDQYQLPFWWDRLLQDTSFVSTLRETYFWERKSGVLSEQAIYQTIDSLKNLLAEPQSRNFAKWPILGQHILPNPYPIPTSWIGEVQELKTWISNRLYWLDNNLPKVKEKEAVRPVAEISAFPNPAVGQFTLDIKTPYPNKLYYKIYDSQGSLRVQSSLWLPSTIQQLESGDLMPGREFSRGVYILDLQMGSLSKVIKMVIL
ncbi:MAG: CotH kinase family protein [Saprospiraceae bacterium]|nr:CotH kinase family protein [Saprospiraceae bacterium]